MRWRGISTPLRILTALLLFSCCTSIAGIVTASKGLNNIYLIHIWVVGSYPFLAILFSFWHYDKSRQLIRISVLAFLVFYLISMGFKLERLSMPPAYSLSIMGLCVAMMSLYTLFTILRRDTSIPIYRDERLWISTGAFIYHSGNAFVFSSILNGIAFDVWAIHNTLESVGNICYFGGLVWTLREISS